MFCLAPFLYGGKLLKVLRIFIKKLATFRDLVLLVTVQGTNFEALVSQYGS
jgi:hypothetical protein